MTGIFYGSTTGNTESLAREIASKLNVDPKDIHDVGTAQADQACAYDLLLLGTSTWGLGDLQDDWDSFIGRLKAMNLSGKKVGLFGCGDSGSYPDTFCDGMGILKEELEGAGCTFIGEIDASDYPQAGSRAFDGDRAIGLAADDDEPQKTELRMDAWIEAVKNA